MTTDHQVLCIEHIDEDGVATMTNHMGRFVHYSHTSVLVRKTPASNNAVAQVQTKNAENADKPAHQGWRLRDPNSEGNAMTHNIQVDPPDSSELQLGRAFALAARPIPTTTPCSDVNLAPLAEISVTEHVSFLKLAIAAEKPTGSASQPSAHFATYVQYAVSDELTKSSPAPLDVMRERLWAAAQHDVFTNTGGIASMLDGMGHPRADYSEYQNIIDSGLQPLLDAGY